MVQCEDSIDGFIENFLRKDRLKELEQKRYGNIAKKKEHLDVIFV